jgi:DNA polymerase III subunit beta
LLVIHATDLEISLKSSINVAANENLSIVVPARLIYDVIRSMEDVQISFSVDGNSKLKLTTENGIYNISYLSLRRFSGITRCYLKEKR